MKNYPITKAQAALGNDTPASAIAPRFHNGVFQVGLAGGGETFTSSSSWPAAQPAQLQPQKPTEKIPTPCPWTQNRLAMGWDKRALEKGDSIWDDDTTKPAKVLLTPRPAPSTSQKVGNREPKPLRLPASAERQQRSRPTPQLFRPLRKRNQQKDERAEAKFLKASGAKSPFADRLVHVAIAALAIAIYIIVQDVRKAPSQAITSSVTKVDSPLQVDRASSRQALDKFLSASDVPALLATIRNGSAKEQGVQKWLAANELTLPLGGKIIDKGNTVNLKSHHLMEFIVQRSATEVNPVAIMETPDGWRVDWNSFTQQGDMSVAEFLAERPTTPVMLLVLAQPDGYFNFDYSNAEQYHCLKLSDNHHAAATFYGYADKSNALATLSMSLVQPNKRTPQRPIPLAICARFTGAATSPPQVEITKVLQDAWFDQ
jgi:hypothetical protein